MPRLWFPRSAVLLASFFFFTSPLPLLAGNIIHVPADQPTIQGAINAASNGDTVLVSAGTYKENITFSGKLITVTSQSGPAMTIIDGQQLGAVVSFTTGETRQSVLSGFTIQNGNGYINYGSTGGGINISGASPTITSNIIRQNSACLYGAAILSNNGSPLIERNMVAANEVSTYCAEADGAITIFGSGSTGSTEIIGNIINGNNSAGVYVNGTTNTTSILENSITFNTSIGVTGGGTGLVVVTQNLITGNQSTGVYMSPPVTFVNNTVADNGIFNFGNSSSEIELAVANGQVVLDNNLIVAVGNSAAFSCQTYDSTPIMSNNDVFSATTQAYAICPDVTGTNGNISADPLFVTLLSDDFHLQAASPAIDAGDNSAPGLPANDFDGDLRVVNNTIDIGIDEYSSDTTLKLGAYGLHYEATAIGSSSSPQTITLTNQGTQATKLFWMGTGGDFSETNTCGSSLAAGANCQISVTFTPTAGGSRAGALGVFTNATSNPLTVNLMGTGLAPAINLYPSFLSFYQAIGTTSSQSATITNDGQAPLAITALTLTQSGTDFSQSSNCPISPQTLAVNASCTITITWIPNIVGNENGTTSIYSNSSPSPLGLTFNGTSVSAGIATLTPASLTFPTVLIGTSSTPQTSTLTNTGTGTLGSINVSSYGDFPATSDCPASLVPGASCSISVVFTPSYNGLEYGEVYVNNDSGFNPGISTSGTGQAPVPTISSLSPANTFAGSSDLSVTVTGTGFFSGSQVFYNGTNLYAYYLGNGQLSFTLPAADLLSAGVSEVTVVNPAPGGGTSNPQPFTVYNPVNYAAASTKYSYQTITGTNLNLFYYSGATVTSPFPIQFGGGTFTNLTVGAGGTISFNGFYSENNDVIPTGQTPMLIAPFWTSLYPFGSGTNNNVFWQVLGTAPNRRLVVEWRNVGFCCETTNTVRFEVVFFEGNGNILFNYADTIFGGAYSANDNGATATSGVQVASLLGTQYSYDQPMLLSKTALLWYPSSPTATVSTSALGFGYHQIGTSTLPQKVTLTNGGIATLQISSIAIDNGDFTQTNTCGSSLASHASCTIAVVFKPSQPSSESATLTITDNATNSPQTVTLTGIGSVTSVVVYPILVNFGAVSVGGGSTLPVVLANASNAALTIQQIVTAPSVYTQTNNCGSSVAPGQSCTVNVTFTPTQTGAVQGSLSMGLNGKPVKVVSKLNGSGS